MKNMKRKIIIGVALFVALWTAENASAWHDPSTGRWLTRDPIGEPGFQLPERFQSLPHLARTISPPRWIHRDSAETENPYLFVRNAPINLVDPDGLYFLPLPINHPFPDDPRDPKKTHLECLQCRRCTAGGVMLYYNGCFMRRPNDTPMNQKAFEECMAPLVRGAQTACSGWDIDALDSIAKRSKICYDHHW